MHMHSKLNEHSSARVYYGWLSTTARTTRAKTLPKQISHATKLAFQKLQSLCILKPIRSIFNLEAILLVERLVRDGGRRE